MRIIINCDDLGLSDAVNAEIFSLIAKGRVTSSTLLMNAPSTNDAIRQLSKFSHISFGVHLNVTQFAPLVHHPGLNPLLNSEGCFAGNVRRLKITRSIQKGIFVEWCAQIDKALELGVPISHLDSHHHVHTEPLLFLVLKHLQKKYGINKIRLTRNLYGPTNRISMPLRFSKSVWNFALHNLVNTQTTNWFTDFSTWYSRMRAGMGINGDIELMVHPGAPEYAEETELLWGDWFKELAPGAKMISYHDI